MAESIVQLLINELSRILKEELALQKGVRQEIEKVKDELAAIQAFLRYADAKKEDPRLISWVEQVRDVSFEIEDVLDNFLFQVAKGDGPHNNCLQKICSKFRKLKAKRQIGSELQSTKSKVNEIAERPKKYGYNPSSNLYEQGSTSSLASSTKEIDQFRSNATLVDESQLVGIDEIKMELVGWLNDGDSNLKVLAIVGMGGLGKTALAKQIYHHMSRFTRRAFAIVSQTFKEEEFLKDITQQLFPGEMLLEMQQLPINHLKERVKERLRDESYLIVVDDVWKVKHWDQIKVLFPRNNHGSRVVVTTRKTHVAKRSSNEYSGRVHELQPLSESASWTLFCKNAFPTPNCPSHLESICKDIVFNKCRGVPIAILAISGLLRSKDVHVVDAWIRKVQHSLDIELEENEELEMTKQILSLSFDELPYHLKPCYMYLSSFPEDYSMEWNKVIRLWISEGFVAKRDGRTPEEDAENYLFELLNRNLIQMVEKKTFLGYRRVKHFRIHDFLRDIVLSKSKEERFVEVIGKAEVMGIRARRLSIHHYDAIKRLPQLLLIRSVSMFFAIKRLPYPDEANDTFSLKLPDFKLLSVLELEKAPVDSFPQEICTLLLLRYLSLRETKISNIPESIGNLTRLETLDLKYTFVAELPDQISMLQKLRHLLIARVRQVGIQDNRFRHPQIDKYINFYGEKDANYATYFSYDISGGVKVTADIRGLVSLQELCFVEVPENNEWIKVLGSLSQLRKLGLTNLREQHWKEVCFFISKMTNLRSLMLQTNGSFELEYLRSPPPSLERLQLNGHLNELPSWVSSASLKNLQQLKLMNTRLKKDPGTSLGGLPNLIWLVLYEALDDGIKMRVVLPGSFPRLRNLIRIEERLMTYTPEEALIDENYFEWLARRGELELVQIGVDELIDLS